MNVSVRGWPAKAGLFLIAYSAASAALVARGALDATWPLFFICLAIGASGVPAVFGAGFIVNAQPLSVQAKRKIIAIAIVLVAITDCGWMFWIFGHAPYN